MKIITGYIFRQALAAVLLVLGSLTAVVWIAVALKQLRVVTGDSGDSLTFLMITALAVPNLVGFVAPVALLVATIHVLNRLNGDSELIILTASGGTIWLIARPFLLLATIIAVLVTVINFYAMPQSLRMVRELLVEARSNLIAQVLEPGNFTNPESGVTIHVRERTIDGELRGILFHDSRATDAIVSVAADRGRIVKQDGEPLLQMLDGQIIRQQAVNGPAEIIAFDSYLLELESFERREGPVELKPRERFLHELLYPAPDDPQFASSPGKFRAEIHERFSNPLYPFAFVLIVLASVGQAQSTRSNRTRAVIAGFLAAALLRLFGLAAGNFVALHEWAVPFMYAVPIAGVIVAIAVIRHNAVPRPGLSRLQRLSFAITDGLTALRARLLSRRLGGATSPTVGSR